MRKGILIFVVLQLVSLAALAGDDLSELDTRIDYSSIFKPQPYDTANLQLAMAGEEAAPASMGTGKTEEVKFKERLFTLNKTHMYLGLGSLGLATLAILSPKQEGNDKPHHLFATGAAILGGGAVATGLTFHFEDFRLKNGFKDPDNLHLLLGAIGALGYILAVNDAPDSLHATYGTVGFASMLVAIKLTW